MNRPRLPMAKDNNPDGDILNAIHAALAQIVPERFVESIVERSRELGLSHQSDDPDRTRAFVDGPLKQALHERFGQQLARLGASQVRSQLGIEKRQSSVPVLDASDVGQQSLTPASEAPRSDVPTALNPALPIDQTARGEVTQDRPAGLLLPPEELLEEAFGAGPETRPLPQLESRNLYFVSPDPKMRVKLASSVGQELSIRWVTHLDQLPPTAEAPGQRSRFVNEVVVLDCRQSAASSLGFGDTAPPVQAGLVILWGSTDKLGDAAAQVARHPNWIRCGAELEASELGMLIRAFSAPSRP